MTLMPSPSATLPSAALPSTANTPAADRAQQDDDSLRTGARGELALRFYRDNDGDPVTGVAVTAQQPPLRVIRAFSQTDGSALVHLHNISGGVLGGDQLALSVRVEPGAHGLLTTTGATRVYRHRTGYLDALQTMDVRIEDGGRLELLPDTLIPFKASRYHQKSRYLLGREAGLFVWEVLSPGRVARGERFAYSRLALDTEIWVESEPESDTESKAGARPIVLESMDWSPARTAVDSAMRLGPYASVATAYICQTGRPAAFWRALEAKMTARLDRSGAAEVVWGASSLVADGLIVRGLAADARLLTETLPTVWAMARMELYGLEAVLPRKIY